MWVNSKAQSTSQSQLRSLQNPTVLLGVTMSILYFFSFTYFPTRH